MKNISTPPKTITSKCVKKKTITFVLADLTEKTPVANSRIGLVFGPASSRASEALAFCSRV